MIRTAAVLILLTSAAVAQQATVVGPAVGTSGATVPLLSTQNTWTTYQQMGTGVAGVGTTWIGNVSGGSNSKVEIQDTSGTLLGLRITLAGSVVAQVKSDATQLVAVSATNTNDLCYNSATGAVTYQAHASGCVVSSARFKNLNEVISPKRALEVATNLTAYRYRYKPEANLDNDEHTGFIAEDVARVAPEFVQYESDGVTPKSVKYNELAPIWAAALSELKSEIARLREEMRKNK